MQQTVMMDMETFSRQDIKYNYAYHETTEVICLAYTFDQVDIKLWTPDKPFPFELVDHVKSGGIVRSYNVNFERSIWNNALYNQLFHKTFLPKIKIEQTRCTMTEALALGLPASLDMCGSALGLDILKDKKGKHLINILSKPRKPTKNKPYDRITPEIEPEKFQEFYDYCIQDVKAEIAIYNELPRELKTTELEAFHHCMKINQRGLPIDKPLCDSIIAAREDYEETVNEKILEITDGELANTNSRPKAIKWLKTEGLELKDYQKGTLESTLKRKDLTDNAKLFLETRLELGRTPIKKFDFIQKAICDDDTIKNNLIFHKATTGRFAGAGFQMQNLPRDSNDNPEELIAKFLSGDIKGVKVIDRAIELTRSVIKAPVGKKLLVSDFAAIENRVLAWVAQDYETLEGFENGADLYIVEAAKIYKKAPEEITKEERQVGKVAVLSGGYGGGYKALMLFAVGYGIEIEEVRAKEIVKEYRDNNRKIVNLWYGLNDAAMQAVEENKMTKYRDIRFKVNGDFLQMKLPSGRLISYYKPKVEMVATPWGQKKETLTHMGQNTYTRKWERLNVTHGRLTENAIQAIARDFLTEAMIRVENSGYSVIGCVHDEVISIVDKSFGSIEEFNKIMEKRPSWALDCPIAAEGFEDERYRK